MTTPCDVEETGAGSTNLLHDYVPPSPIEKPKVTVGKNARYQLVRMTIPKGVHVMMDIIPNLKNMRFIDHHLQNFP